MRSWIVGVVVVVLQVGMTANQIADTDASRFASSGSDFRFSGEPVVIAGASYYPSGPTVFFDGAVMVRSSSFKGVPIYPTTSYTSRLAGSSCVRTNGAEQIRSPTRWRRRPLPRRPRSESLPVKATIHRKSTCRREPATSSPVTRSKPLDERSRGGSRRKPPPPARKSCRLD